MDDIKSLNIGSYIGSYKVSKKLGSGAYGSVYKVFKDKLNYAAKEIKVENLHSLIEIDLTMRIRNPHIVRGIDLVTKKNKVTNNIEYIYLIQELADSDLSTYLKNNKISLIDKIRLMFEIGSALQFLYDKGILHCDIKSINILILDGRAILADMGISVYMSERVDICETVFNRAPEFLRIEYTKELKDYRNKYEDIKSMRTYMHGEIWSYGMICLELLYNKSNVFSYFPEQKFDMDNFLNRLNKFSIAKDKTKFILDNLGELPDDEIPLLNLILSKLLVFDLRERAHSFTEFIQDDMFYKHNMILNPNTGDLTYLESSNVVESSYKNYSIVNAWIMDVLYELKQSNRVSFLTLTLIRDLWNKYVKKLSEAQLFGSACLFLASMVLNSPNNMIIEDELEWYSDNTFTSKELVEYAMKLFINENGMISRTTLYDYLSSLEMLKQAILYIKDERFAKMDSKDIADEIILNETVEEANNRKLKNSGMFEKIYKLSA